MTRLKGKVAVVTGAADGIGQVIAETMAKEGASVVLADIQEEKGQQASQSIAESGGKALFIKTDVSQEKDMQALLEQTVQRYGKLDILVNNAAVAIGGMPINEMTEEQWQKIIAVNFSSVFRGCKFAIPHMIKNGSGSIINMASAQAHNGLQGWSAYAGIKGGVIAMSKQLAVEFGPNNIRVNTISPGTISTPMVEKVIRESEDGESIMRSFVDMHPIGRIGKPEEVAETAVYLASDASGFTTGTDIRVDGGLCITARYKPDSWY
ncbi:short-chain dehydrogenase [Vibrio nigripulchritudo]|uniref:SDR family NAD(P)-dependent oxidoreductase n=1 Tax=Vibrio nigripulchritudo TaxID=28173 RepID=UPI00190B7DD0|nr:glucose 1-dehydrogenase [Vibrio nigripulchritudo]BCL71131.1 short-chain dehydrogenase [Vibrio nigripulchritudo]BDU32487.1 short-chain dehydrogenase [Vibrio nigripulchritudo]